MTDMNFASLSPTLLARKGGAKPAMRRQSPIIAGGVAGAQAHQPRHSTNYPDSVLEDLGWNDLGESSDAPTPAAHANDVDETEAEQDTQFARLSKHAESTATAPEHEAEAVEDNNAPAERAQNVTPIRKGAPRLPRPSQPMAAEASAKHEPKGKRTAFTLRLDPARHLKLRMACTLANRSAQSLVTEAVDAMFAATPELETLVARVHSHSPQEG